MSESHSSAVTHQIKLAAQGDYDAKTWLWERYRKLLYAMAHDHQDNDSRTGAADTSDIVAEVGVRFTGNDLFAHVRDREHFQALLRHVVRGKAIDQIRREMARPADELGDDSQVAPAVQDYQLAEMNDLLDQLPLILHETALTMLEWGNEREAAEKLRITRHELRNRLEQIRDIWSKHLSK